MDIPYTPTTSISVERERQTDLERSWRPTVAFCVGCAIAYLGIFTWKVDSTQMLGTVLAYPIESILFLGFLGAAGLALIQPWRMVFRRQIGSCRPKPASRLALGVALVAILLVTFTGWSSLYGRPFASGYLNVVFFLAIASAPVGASEVILSKHAQLARKRQLSIGEP